MRAFFESGNHVTFEQVHNFDPSGPRPDHNYMRLLGLNQQTRTGIDSNEHTKKLFDDLKQDVTHPRFQKTHTIEQEQQHEQTTAHQTRSRPRMAPEVWKKHENKAYNDTHFQTGLKPFDDMSVYITSHPWWQHFENIFTSKLTQQAQPVDWALLNRLDNLKPKA